MEEISQSVNWDESLILDPTDDVMIQDCRYEFSVHV